MTSRLRVIKRHAIKLINHFYSGVSYRFGKRYDVHNNVAYIIVRNNHFFTQEMILYDLILYVPSTIFQLNRDWSSWVS